MRKMEKRCLLVLALSQGDRNSIFVPFSGAFERLGESGGEKNQVFLIAMRV
jgi:hypothetical protein